ncbi:MAG: hypothetical protein U0L18_02880 [Acutalibacteraceae bacterium]|nr:hypothetical protein [Acutalibacteraceae bacterium]
MIAELIGKKQMHFTDDKGKAVEIYTLNCIHKNPPNDNSTQYEGQGCSQVNVPEAIFNSLNVGQKYVLDFDKKGKLLEVTEL